MSKRVSDDTKYLRGKAVPIFPAVQNLLKMWGRRISGSKLSPTKALVPDLLCEAETWWQLPISGILTWKSWTDFSHGANMAGYS